MEKYPEINIEPRKVDLIEEKYDLAIIPGVLEDSSLISRKIGTTHYIYCASPKYLKEHGSPKILDELLQHQFINYVPPSYMMVPIDPITEQAKIRIQTNNFFVAWRSAKDGLGIARLPELQISEDLKAGRLIRVIPDFSEAMALNLVFPGNKHFTTKLRAAIDHFVSFSKEFAPWDKE